MAAYLADRTAVNGSTAEPSTLALSGDQPDSQVPAGVRRRGRPRSTRGVVLGATGPRLKVRDRVASDETPAPRLPDQPPARAQSALLTAARFGPWGLAIVFLCVSMPHLSAGFARITGCEILTGWLMAVAIDSAQVVSKLQLTLAKSLTVGRAARLTSFAIIFATSGLSMTLNVLAFLQHAEGTTGVTLAWGAGLTLPLFVLGLSFTGAAFCLAGHSNK